MLTPAKTAFSPHSLRSTYGELCEFVTVPYVLVATTTGALLFEVKPLPEQLYALANPVPRDRNSNADFQRLPPNATEIRAALARNGHTAIRPVNWASCTSTVASTRCAIAVTGEQPTRELWVKLSAAAAKKNIRLCCVVSRRAAGGWSVHLSPTSAPGL